MSFIDTYTLNSIANPYFPFICFYPSLYDEKRHTVKKEALLFTTQVRIHKHKRNGLLVFTNQRAVVYLLGDGFFKRNFKSLVNFGLDELKGEIIGQIPIVSDLEALYSKVKENTAVDGPSDKEIKKELERLTSIVIQEEAVFLDNTENWEVLADFNFKVEAENVVAIYLTSEEINFEWKSFENTAFPKIWLKKPPIFYSDYVLSAIWSIVLLFESQLKVAGLHVVKTEDGLIISSRKEADTSDFSWLSDSDPVHLLKPKKEYPIGYEKSWIPEKSQIASDNSVNLDDKLLTGFEELFPKGQVFMHMKTNWLGKTTFEEFEVRPMLIARGDELEESDKEFIASILNKGEIPFKRILVAHNGNFKKPYFKGFVLTEQGIVKWDTIFGSQSPEFLPYAEQTDKSISDLFSFGLNHTFENPIVVEGETNVEYFKDAIIELLSGFVVQNNNSDSPFDISNFKQVGNLPNDLFGLLRNQNWCVGIDSVLETGVNNLLIRMHLIKVKGNDNSLSEWYWYFSGKLPELYLNATIVTDPVKAFGVYLRAMDQLLENSEKAPVAELICDFKPSSEELSLYAEIHQFLKNRLYPNL